MTVGLTLIELMNTFSKSWDKRNKELDVEIANARKGSNPSVKKIIDQYRQLFPEAPEKQALASYTQLLAIFDTIVRNNEAIGK